MAITIQVGAVDRGRAGLVLVGVGNGWSGLQWMTAEECRRMARELEAAASSATIRTIAAERPYPWKRRR